MLGFECTVTVDDLAELTRRVDANGGTVVYDEVEIPTVGTLVQFRDSEGNVCSAMDYSR
jgi:predicted enzyme related to lactoylglutathione lyase